MMPITSNTDEAASDPVCALMTIFRPNVSKTIINLRTILCYVDAVFLLGNSEIPDALIFDVKIIPVKNRINIGISRSVNIGAAYALKKGYKYAILFDQDSILDEKNFRHLFLEMKHEERYRNVACIGPSLVVRGQVEHIPGWKRNKTLKPVTKQVVSVKCVITSGMIVNLRNFSVLKGFDENFPVDFSDYTFSWKAVHANFAVLQSSDVYMDHEVGIGTLKVFGKNLHYHHPYRDYFMSRDALFVCFRLPDTPFSMRFRSISLSPVRMIIFILLLKDRKQRLKMYFLGIMDFFRNRRGFGSIASLLGADDNTRL
jgi:rhamnosyltransferase